MMRPDAKVEKVYLYPKPMDFRKSIDGLAALVELDLNTPWCCSTTPPVADRRCPCACSKAIMAMS